MVDIVVGCEFNVLPIPSSSFQRVATLTEVIGEKPGLAVILVGTLYLSSNFASCTFVSGDYDFIC